MRNILLAVGTVIVLGGVVALARVGGSKPASIATAPSSGGAPSAGAAEGKGRSPLTPEHAEWSFRALLDAFYAEDAEAGLIALVREPHDYSDARAARLLKDVGGQRAAAALREALQDMEAGTRKPPEAWLTHDNANLFLWVVETLNPLSPKQQLPIIAEELEKIQASRAPSQYQADVAAVLVTRLVDLALPESLPLLWKLVEEDVKLPHYGPRSAAQGHWLPHETVVDALDRIDDASAIDVLEMLTSPEVIGEFPRESSTIWWRWRLRTVTQDEAVGVLTACVLTRWPRAGAMLPGVGARLIGPACVPALGQMLLDKSAVPRLTGAAEALGVLGHPDGIPFLRQAAEDTSEAWQVRDTAMFGLELFNNPAGTQALLDIAEACSAAGDRWGVRGALHDVACVPGGRERIQALSAHPSSLVRDAADTSLREDYPTGLGRPLVDQHTGWPPSLEYRTLASQLKQQGRPFDHATIASLGEQLKDPDPYRRYDAIWVLGWIGDYDSIPHLTACARAETDPKNMQLLIDTLPRLYLLRNLPK